VQRLCGICPVSHHLCAAKAMDRIVGVENLTADRGEDAPADALRPDVPVARAALLPPGSPDLLFGFDADPAIRNVIGVAAEAPDLACRA
jgi:NAD-reducing hydrogenase large subunit